MHQCLSCNQPCDHSSMFCDTCRASLLARQDQASGEKQPEMARAGTAAAAEHVYPAWNERDTFPVPDQPVYADPPLPAEENNAWSYSTVNIQMPEQEQVEEPAQAGESDGKNRQTRKLPGTPLLPLPTRPRRVLPRNVRRALWIFCVVGVLALLTDGTLLVLSITHHRPSGTAHTRQPGVLGQQGTLSTTGGGTPTGSGITPIATARVNAVSLLVLSTQRLVFSAVQGQSTALSQAVTLAADRQGFVWQIASVGPVPAWLHLSTWQGSNGPGVPSSFVVSVSPLGLAPAVYTANLQVKAFDAQGNALSGSPTTLTMSLTVHPPCALSVTPEKLTFTSVLFSVPPPQTLTLNENPGCAYPIAWQATSDAPWLTLTRASGSESASGSTITVQASTTGKLIGNYTAHITFQGTDSSGTPLVTSSATITVTLTVIA